MASRVMTVINAAGEAFVLPAIECKECAGTGKLQMPMLRRFTGRRMDPNCGWLEFDETQAYQAGDSCPSCVGRGLIVSSGPASA